MRNLVIGLMVLMSAATSYAGLRGKVPSMNGATDVYYESGVKPANAMWVGDLPAELRDASEVQITVQGGAFRAATAEEISARSQPDYYRVLVSSPDAQNSGSWREFTAPEKAAVDAMTVTNIVVKPTAVQGNPVQEAEAGYLALYAAFYGDGSYTNAQKAKVSVDVMAVALTNTTWAARTDLFQSTFNIIETWWMAAKGQLGLAQENFHPYPWGQAAATNVVKKYPLTSGPLSMPKTLKAQGMAKPVSPWYKRMFGK
jgi:hypothetical protein